MLFIIIIIIIYLYSLFWLFSYYCSKTEENNNENQCVTLDHKTVISCIGICSNNKILYGSKLSIFLLCQKSLG